MIDHLISDGNGGVIRLARKGTGPLYSLEQSLPESPSMPTDRPQPPQGHCLVIQEIQPDGSCLWMPGIPAEKISTLLVWNPWQGKWEKPKYLCRDIDAILCVE